MIRRGEGDEDTQGPFPIRHTFHDLRRRVGLGGGIVTRGLSRRQAAQGDSDHGAVDIQPSLEAGVGVEAGGEFLSHGTQEGRWGVDAWVFERGDLDGMVDVERDVGCVELCTCICVCVSRCDCAYV